MSALPMGRAMMRWADTSDDGLYRYVLGRRWDDGLPECVFIMLNPSTADAVHDDPTIRRCIGFGQSLRCGAILVGNLYAYRATDPRDLFRAAEPTGGARNDAALAGLLCRGDYVIAGWGVRARRERVSEFLRLPGAERITALAVTKGGAPRHPLYLPAAVSSHYVHPVPSPTPRLSG